MRKLGVKLTAFDLLYWINGDTVSNDRSEQTIVRNTLINLMDLYDHYCIDEKECVVCQRPENIFVTNRISEIVNHPLVVEESDRKYAAVVKQLEQSGTDLSVLYSAFLSPTSDTVLRTLAYKGVMDDFGNMSYGRRGIVSVIGSNQPTVLQSDEFGATGFNGTLNLTMFIDESNHSESWENENILAATEMSKFVEESLSPVKVGDIELPSSIERLEAEVLAIGGVRDGEREVVSIERHKIMDATRSHPVLGRLANGNNVWQIISYGNGITINEAMRLILGSEGEPSLTTSEVIKLASIVFSKRGVQHLV